MKSAGFGPHASLSAFCTVVLKGCVHKCSLLWFY